MSNVRLGETTPNSHVQNWTRTAYHHLAEADRRLSPTPFCSHTAADTTRKEVLN